MIVARPWSSICYAHSPAVAILSQLCFSDSKERDLFSSSANIMSLIHCSPLFHPLEPLPIMSPTVMRSGNRKTSVSAGSSISSPAKTDQSSAKSRGKKPASRRVSHPLADTPITMPVNDPMPPPTLPNASADDLTTLINAATAAEAQPDLLAASYNDSFDSEGQGSLTFTLESQPMSDLSSSQQPIN